MTSTTSPEWKRQCLVWQGLEESLAVVEGYYLVITAVNDIDRTPGDSVEISIKGCIMSI